MLVHLDGFARADLLRDQLHARFSALPVELRRSLTWYQGSEMFHHHTIAETIGMPNFVCDPGRSWQRPTNENTNGLLRDHFPKSTDQRVHIADDLARVSDEPNGRPRKTLGWQTPHALFSSLQERFV